MDSAALDPGSDSRGEREERIAAVLAECSDRLGRGEPIDSRAVLAAHADLMPELEWALGTLSEACVEPHSELRVESIGRHRILGEIGRGGMGIVYHAVELTLGRRVALKVLPLPAFAQGDRRERFLREARAAARLHHTRIVPVFEVGEEAGVLYYTMQHIEGRSLDRVLRAERLRALVRPPAAPTENRDELAERIAAMMSGGAGEPADIDAFHLAAARIGAEVAHALSHAHREGVLHRDVKPSNVIIDVEGSPWLTDFGLAKSERESDALTQSGDVVGTVAYMAPERLAGESDARGDIYSLGATLHELLVLRPPFQGIDRRRLMQAVAEGAAPPARRVDARIPRDLETIVLKAMAREPRHRYASAQDLAEDLERFQRGEPIAARRLGPVEKLTRWCRRHRLVASLLGAVACLLLTLVAVLLVSAHRLRERLFEAELARARALIVSGQPGRRVESLAAIGRAAPLVKDGAARAALRDAAVQALGIPDLSIEARRDEPLFTSAPRRSSPAVSWYAVVVAGAGEISVRDVASGREIHRLRGAEHVWHLAAIGAGGAYLAGYREHDGRRSTLVWRVAEGDVWMSMEGGATEIPIDLDPSTERAVIARADGSIAQVDLRSRSEERSWTPPRRAERLKLAPSGTEIALISAPPHVVEVWDLQAGRRLASIDGLGTLRDLSWSPDSRLLATAARDEHIRLWEPRSGDLVRRLEGHSGSVMHVSFSPGGEALASTSWDGTLRLWDPWNGDLLLTTPADNFSTDFNRDGRSLGTLDGELVVWKLEPARERLIFRSPRAPANVGGHNVRFHAGSRLLWSAWDCIDAVLARPVDVGFSAQEESSAVSSPDGRFVVIKSGRGVILRKCEMVESADGPVLRLGVHGRVLPLSASTGPMEIDATGKRLAAVESRGRVVLLDLSGAGKKRTLGVHAGADRLSMDAGTRWLASGTWVHGRGVKIWDVESGSLVQELEASQSARGIFSPRGPWLAVSVAAVLRILETGTWRERRVFTRAAGDSLHAPAVWHPGGRIVAHGVTPSDVQLCDVESGDILARLGTSQLRRVQSMDISSDGRRLAVARANASVEIWDLGRIAAGLDGLGLPLHGELAADAPGTAREQAVRVERVDDAPPGGDPAAPVDADALPADALRDLGRLHDASATLVEASRFQQNIRLWERARTVAPEAADTANSLAWALLACPEELRDPGRALTLAEEAVQLAPDVPAFRNTLGVAQYRSGRFQDAVETLLWNARQGAETTAWDGLFIAMALKRQGLDALAGDYLRAARRWLDRNTDLTRLEWRELRAFLREADELFAAGSPAGAR